MENENRRTEDAERLPAEELEWPDCGACPGNGTICPKTCRLAEESPPIPAAPAVDAAKLPPLPEFFALGKTRINGEEHGHFDAKQMQDYARAAIAAAQALPVDAAKFNDLQVHWLAYPGTSTAAQFVKLVDVQPLVAQQAARIAAQDALLREVEAMDNCYGICGVSTGEATTTYDFDKLSVRISEFLATQEGK